MEIDLFFARYLNVVFEKPKEIVAQNVCSRIRYHSLWVKLPQEKNHSRALSLSNIYA